jgi:5-formyltetrahydrofolate cyclo-ligase
VQRSANAIPKAELRTAALNRRDGLDSDFRRRASDIIAAKALPFVLAERPKVVSGYWPIRSEVDARALLERLAARGTTVALPVIVDRRELRFRAWRPGDPIAAAGFGTFEPRADAPEIVPDVMLVPLAGFDRTGHRIGYGKGYYDKAIAGIAAGGHRPVLIGLAFSVQEVPAVPAETHDVRLDRIVTETAVWTNGQVG